MRILSGADHAQPATAVRETGAVILRVCAITVSTEAHVKWLSSEAQVLLHPFTRSMGKATAIVHSMVWTWLATAVRHTFGYDPRNLFQLQISCVANNLRLPTSLKYLICDSECMSDLSHNCQFANKNLIPKVSHYSHALYQIIMGKYN